MERQDNSSSVKMCIGPEPDHSAVLDFAIPFVSYLGPVSSYTHQVYTLVQATRPPWSIGLTDYDLAQAALQCFNADEYDYKPATTIPGYTAIPDPHS